MMDETGKKLLNLMFRPGETICVSHNQFGYHSIPLENAINGPVVLVPTQDSLTKRKITLEEGIEKIDPGNILLCALNPIKGFREDSNCTGYRNFLIEMDYGPLSEQLAYAKQIGLPYSAVVFSGNKSLHFLISLVKDLPNEEIWRTMAEWILNIATLADPQTKNPSRSIRVPGAYREPDKKQRLVELKGPIRLTDLAIWLASHPEAKPVKREKKPISEDIDLSMLKPWVADRLVNGLDPSKGRNGQWYSIAYEFALSGFSEDDTIDILSGYFVPDRDFKEKEWKTTINSAFKSAYRKA